MWPRFSRAWPSRAAASPSFSQIAGDPAIVVDGAPIVGATHRGHLATCRVFEATAHRGLISARDVVPAATHRGADTTGDAEHAAAHRGALADRDVRITAAHRAVQDLSLV